MNGKRIAVTFLVTVGLLALTGTVATSAEAVAGRVLATVVPSGRTVVIPERAVEVTPGVFSLGTAISDGQVVEGYAILRYRDGFLHQPEQGGGTAKAGGKASCFGFLARDAKWKTTEPYVLDTANNDGLSAAFVETTTSTSLETWDTEVAFDIFGPRDTSSAVDGADTTGPDGKNEIFFGDIAEDGAIAVAIVWGVFRGPPSQRVLVEHDVVFDDVDFTWGDATANPTVMDYQNIATHEFGHSAGLVDLYRSRCSEQTMYGFAGEGETKKRTLEAGDIAGITKLYQ